MVDAQQSSADAARAAEAARAAQAERAANAQLAATERTKARDADAGKQPNPASAGGGGAKSAETGKAEGAKAAGQTKSGDAGKAGEPTKVAGAGSLDDEKRKIEKALADKGIPFDLSNDQHKPEAAAAASAATDARARDAAKQEHFSWTKSESTTIPEPAKREGATVQDRAKAKEAPEDHGRWSAETWREMGKGVLDTVQSAVKEFGDAFGPKTPAEQVAAAQALHDQIVNEYDRAANPVEGVRNVINAYNPFYQGLVSVREALAAAQRGDARTYAREFLAAALMLEGARLASGEGPPAGPRGVAVTAEGVGVRVAASEGTVAAAETKGLAAPAMLATGKKQETGDGQAKPAEAQPADGKGGPASPTETTAKDRSGGKLGKSASEPEGGPRPTTPEGTGRVISGEKTTKTQPVVGQSPTWNKDWNQLVAQAEIPVQRQNDGGFRTQTAVSTDGRTKVVITEGIVGQQVRGKSTADYGITLPGEHSTHPVGRQVGEDVGPSAQGSAPATFNLSEMKVFENRLADAARVVAEQGGTVETRTVMVTELRNVKGQEVPVTVGVRRMADIRLPGRDPVFLMRMEVVIDPRTRAVTVLTTR